MLATWCSRPRRSRRSRTASTCASCKRNATVSGRRLPRPRRRPRRRLKPKGLSRLVARTVRRRQRQRPSSKRLSERSSSSSSSSRRSSSARRRRVQRGAPARGRRPCGPCRRSAPPCERWRRAQATPRRRRRPPTAEPWGPPPARRLAQRNENAAAGTSPGQQRLHYHRHCLHFLYDSTAGRAPLATTTLTLAPEGHAIDTYRDDRPRMYTCTGLSGRRARPKEIT
mmetsp:Transcript_6533/g.26607  ORF Transcript_6533/g.26607 Transcript_6533/m.26607 type:complete len:226 (-) Transcript_6533:336-1013(-)